MKNEQNQTILAGKVPAGYKQTEVGIIPEDWEVVRLGNIVETNLSRKNILPNQLVSFVGMQDVSEDAKLIRHNLIKFQNINKGLTYFEKGDVLVAKITPCFENGKGALTKKLKSQIGFGSTEFHILRSNIHSIPEYVYYWSIDKSLRFKLEQEMIGSAGHKRVPLQSLLSYQIPLPPLKEQTAIAEALSDMDSLLVSLEKLIEKKRAIKTGTMQQLLTGKKRLPAFAQREDGTPKGYKTTELGEIPEDWEVKSIIQVCDVLTGYPFSSAKFSDSGTKLLRGSNVKRNAVDWTDEILMYWPTAIGLSDYELKSGDIVIAMDGSLVGRSFAQISSEDLPCLLVQRVARLRSKSVDQNYIKEWVCSIFFTNYCDSVKTVTAIPHISPKDIQEYNVLIPRNIEEQTAIAEILSDMDAEIEALEAKRAKTEEIKQGMMQELLTGRTRLI